MAYRPLTKPDKTHRITPEIAARLESLFEFVEPNEFRDYLIEIYHSYILHEHHSLPYDFKTMSESVTIFLDLLKFTEEQFTSQHGNPRYLKKELPKKAALKRKLQATRT